MPAKRQCDGPHAAGSATGLPCRYYHTHRLPAECFSSESVWAFGRMVSV
jgi:hypothetical protein